MAADVSNEDEAAIERFDAVTDDPDRIDELTRSMFGADVRVERHDGRPPSLRLAQAATSTFGVQRVTWNVDGHCDVEPLGRLLCVRLHRGVYGLDQGGGRTPYVAGDTFLFDPARKIDADVIAADLQSFSIELPALEAVAMQISPWSSGRLDYRRPTPVTPQLAKVLDGVLTDTVRMLTEDDPVAENPLIRAGLLFNLAATACAAFELVDADRSERSVPARVVRRAIAYIEDHMAEAITVGDIAAAAGLSTRGLHAAFQRVLDIGPYAYLRRARLHAVRQDLTDADGGTSVAAVARRWGFTHLSRFADSYRDEFGELPSTTLRT